MSFLDKLGGMGKIMDLLKNPERAVSTIAPMLAASMPGTTHMLGRAKLYAEIAGHAGLLNMNAHRLLTMAMVQQRDVSREETATFNAMEMQMLNIAKALNKYPPISEGMNLDTLAAAYGLQSGHAQNGQAKGNGHDTEAGEGHAGPA